MKKNFTKLTLACYVIAGIGAVYGLFKLYAAYAYLNSYFGAYGASISSALGDAVSYMLQQTMPAIAFAVIMFMLGTINDKLDAIQNSDIVLEFVDEEAEAAREAAEEAAVVAAGEAEVENATDSAEVAETEAETEEVIEAEVENAEAEEVIETSEK